MNKLQVDQFIERCNEKNKGAKIVRVTYQADVKALKKSRETKEPAPFHALTCVSTRAVTLGADYENCVNNQRGREGLEQTFESQGIWGGKGQHIDKYFVEHTGNGKVYLAGLQSSSDIVQISDTQYFADGVPVDKESVAEYLPARKTDNKSQGTERPVKWRYLDVAGIKEIKYGDVIVKEGE